MNQAKESAEHAADKLTSHDSPAQQVGQKTDETAEKAGEKMDEAAGKAGEKLEEAGEAIQQKAHQ